MLRLYMKYLMMKISLYVKSVNNNDYLYHSNKIFIDENIFYNFTKDV